MKFKDVVNVKVAHDVEGGERTADVDVNESVDFASLLLSSAVREGLTRQGFKRPSPIQLNAIPVGKLGLGAFDELFNGERLKPLSEDMVVQAKSGTGKTCVFSVLALEMVQLQNPAPQVVIVAPTREIATQIFGTVQGIGVSLKPAGLRVGLFIGGTSLMQDKAVLRGSCQVIVGTPGRLCQLVQSDILSLGAVRLFVLDEADKLMEESYQQNVNYLFSRLPPSKQVAVFSATYPGELDEMLSQYMRTPTMVRLDTSNVQLLGIKQYFVICPRAVIADVIDVKLNLLFKLLERVQFTQCLIFCNYQDKCEMVCDALKERGYEAQFIAGTLGQDQRNRVMKKLKLFQTRLLVSTDLTARGIDAPNVNMVVNLEVPQDCETYFHRIGRAGRFGGYGAAVTLAVEGVDDRRFGFLALSGEFQAKRLPPLELTPVDLCTNETFWQSQPLINFKNEIVRMKKFAKVAAEDEAEKDNDDSIVFYGKPSPVKKTPTAAVSTVKVDLYKLKKLIQPIPDPNRLSPEMWMDRFGRRKDNFILAEVDRTSTVAYSRADMINLMKGDEVKKAAFPVGKDQVFQALGLEAPLKESLKVPLETSLPKQEKRRYDRVQLMEIRDCLPSSFFESHALSSNLNAMSTKETTYSTELGDMKLFMSERKTAQSKQPPPMTNTVSAKPKLAPYVPSRLRNKPKYYMRGELLAVRDGVNANAWRQFAESKWNLTEQPFRFANFDEEVVELSKSTDVVVADEDDLLTSSSTSDHTPTNTLTHSREAMMAIRNAVMPHHWKARAEKMWDIAEDPFVVDAELRCPFAQQLRIVRARQTVEQKAVLEQRRQKARQAVVVVHAPRIKPSADHPPTDSKWPFGPHYDLQLAADFQSFCSLRDTPTVASQPPRGPVVARRRSKADWTQALLDAETTLQTARCTFEKAINAQLTSSAPTDELATDKSSTNRSSTDKSPISTDVKVQQCSFSPVGQHRTIRYDRNDMMTIWQDVVKLDVDITTLPSIQKSRQLGIFVFREFTIDDEDNEEEEIDEADDGEQCEAKQSVDAPQPLANSCIDVGSQTCAVDKSDDVREQRQLMRNHKPSMNEEEDDDENERYKAALDLYYTRMQQWQELYDSAIQRTRPSMYQQINSYVNAMSRARCVHNQ